MNHGETTPSYYRLVDTATMGGMLEETFSPTPDVGSPWTDTAQHGGPPAALAARAMDRLGHREDTRLTHVSVDILGAVPMQDLIVRARIERPGRRIELLSAEIVTREADGTERSVVRASAWRLSTGDSGEVAHLVDPPMASSPDSGPAVDVFGGWHHGFANSVEWRAVTNLAEHGTPSTAWFRLGLPFVAGEEDTGLIRVVAISDIANGLGSRLDGQKWLFLNTNLVVQLHTEPRGEWIGMVAETTIGPNGAGMSSAVLHDLHGPIGRVMQNLLVEPR